MRKLLRVIFLLLALILMSVIVFRYAYRRAPEDLSGVKSEFTIEASELIALFENDPKKAADHYTNKVGVVWGELIHADKDEWGQTVLLLEDPMAGVIAIIDSLGTRAQEKIIENLTVGDRIQIKGECQGYLDEVRFSKCLLLLGQD